MIRFVRVAVIVLSGLTLLYVASMDARAQSYWIDVEDPSELRTLHSNKTHKGLGSDAIAFVGHYRADGKALLLRDSERIARTWEVRGNQVCYADEKFSGCRRFQRARTSPDEFNVIHEAGWSAMIKVQDGVPQF